MNCPGGTVMKELEPVPTILPGGTGLQFI